MSQEPARFQHTYQTAALERIARARMLLAEAAGFLRACDREVYGGAEAISNPSWACEKTESELGQIAAQINMTALGPRVA